jgi:hypothetical protein
VRSGASGNGQDGEIPVRFEIREARRQGVMGECVRARPRAIHLGADFWSTRSIITRAIGAGSPSEAHDVSLTPQAGQAVVMGLQPRAELRAEEQRISVAQRTIRRWELPGR